MEIIYCPLCKQILSPETYEGLTCPNDGTTLKLAILPETAPEKKPIYAS